MASGDLDPANNPPVNTVPAVLAVSPPGGSVPVAGLSVADPDAGDGAMRVTLSVLTGLLTLSGVDGAAVLGSGTHSVAIDGTLAQINATLSASNNLVYHAHLGSGADILTMTSDDLGHTGPTDGGPSLTDTDIVLIAIAIADPTSNVAPSDLFLSHASVDEFAANGTLVGTLTDFDANPGDTAAFSLLADAGGRFAISGSDLIVANSIPLDYEQQATHDVTIRVTDSGGLTFDKAFTIALNDVNPEHLVGTSEADVIVGGALDDNVNGAGGADTIIGAAGNDRLGGGAGDDVILGGAGNDTIWGEDGNDAINAGDDNDIAVGGIGDDRIGGGTGDDTIDGDAGNDTIWGEGGNDRLGGGAGNDVIVGMDGNDAIWGEAGDDIIDGGTGADIVLGGTGNDQIGGGAGNDDLRGDAGDDTLWGEAGDDILNGGSGHDVLIGGAGSDIFVFSPGDGADIITDFTPGDFQADRIWLAGTDLHSFADVLAHASFNSVTGAMTITHGAGDTITLLGVAPNNLSASDFIFT